MQNIEINTTQNVRITYEVAHLGDRISALLIDLLIVGGCALISMLFSAIIAGEVITYVFYILIVPFACFYTLVSEIMMKGQTLGKRALKILVVKLNGEEAKPSDFFLRWIFRLIDIYLSLGIIATVFVSASKKGQRVGDLVSETTLIRIKPASQMSLSEIEERNDASNYEVTYPQVTKLKEADMLIIQNVLKRYEKYNNTAHREVLFELVNNVKKKLDINDQEINEESIKFLTRLIKDYIVLTR